MGNKNFFWLAVVSWIMIIAMIVSHNLHWYIWIFVALAILERVFVAAMLWLEAQIIKATAQRMMQQFTQQSGNNPFSALGGPPTDPPNLP